jgi:uncharacterized membrane protein YjjP (DUF1212 family)
MPLNNGNKPDNINRKDLELIFEVNKKAIEVQTAVAEQNEDIIKSLNDNKTSQEDAHNKLDKILKQSEDTAKDIFKLQVLFITGLLSLVVQIIQIFLKK